MRRLQNVFALLNPEKDAGDFKVIIVFYFKIDPQLFHKEVLAKPPEWEGQRPRCPRFAATLGGATSPLTAIRRRMGNEDVAPPWFCKCLYNT